MTKAELQATLKQMARNFRGIRVAYTENPELLKGLTRSQALFVSKYLPDAVQYLDWDQTHV